MIKSRKICLAEDDAATRYSLEKMLQALGHNVVGVARSGEELIELCERHKPELVVTDIVMPGLDGIAVAEQLWHRFNLPVILVSAYHNQEYLNRAESDPVFGYLVKPVDEADLETAIRVAMARHFKFEQLVHETRQLRESLTARKLIERAKGILMKRSGVSAEEAERKLQALADARDKRLAEIASTIIEGDELLSSK
jgi:two-component system, response regulator PdtaR